MQNKMGTIVSITAAVLLLCGLFAFAVYGAVSHFAGANKPGALLPASIIDFHYSEMASQLASMTELQRSDYLRRLTGTHYRVTGTVTEVLSTGQVNVKADGCPSICVLLQAPSSVGLSWQRGQAIRFVGVATWQSAYFNSLLLHLNFERLD